MENKQKNFLILYVLFVLSLVILIQPIFNGYFLKIEEQVDTENPLNILIVGENEFGMVYSADSNIIHETSENVSLYFSHENSEMSYIDPLIFDANYLKEEGYNRTELPVIITLDCDSKSNNQYGLMTASQKSVYATSKKQLKNQVAINKIKSEIPMLCSVSVDLNKSEILDIASEDYVTGISLDKKYYVNLDESVPSINANKVWNLTDNNNLSVNGTGIKIAVLDTGLDPNHPDFQGKNIEHEFFISTSNKALRDENGHGTHVASIAAGTGNASNKSFIGVAPGADLMIGIVLRPEGYGFESQIINGIEWAIENEADVISVSFGVSRNGDGTDLISQALDIAVEQGITVSVSSGNSGENGFFTVGRPAVAKDVITVGAYNKNTNDTAWFSSKGPTEDGRLKPNVIAPGTEICAANSSQGSLGTKDSVDNCGNEYYLGISGTSMASPHISGAAALILQKNPEYTPDIIKSILTLTSKDLGDSIYEQGAGLIDVEKAISSEIYTTPSIVDFGVVSNETEKKFIFEIFNIADYNLSLNLSTDVIKGINGVEYDNLEINVSEIGIPLGESEFVEVKLIVDEDMKEFHTSNIQIILENSTYNLPVGFSRYSKLTVGVNDGEKTLRPAWVFLFNKDDYTDYRVIVNDRRFGMEFGNTYTFFLPKGEYKILLYGDQLFESPTGDFKEYNYFLGNDVNITYGDDINNIYNLEDEPVIYYRNKSFDGIPIKIERLQGQLRCNFAGDIYSFQHTILSRFYESPGKHYLSNNICDEQEFYFQFYGTPKVLNPTAIQNEYYFGGWKIDENIDDSLNLSYENHSIISANYDIPGKLDYSLHQYDTSHFGSYNNWFSPIWFSEWSYVRRVPINHRIINYLVSNVDYDYRLVTFISNLDKQSNNKLEYTLPQLITISEEPKELNVNIGKNPYNTSFFYIDVETDGDTWVKLNDKLISTYENTFVRHRYSNNLRPSVYVYRNGTHYLNETSHDIWEEFSRWAGKTPNNHGVYLVNATIPIRYVVPRNVVLKSSMNFTGSNVYPPRLVKMDYDVFYEIGEELKFDFEFYGENGIQNTSFKYKFGNEEWTNLDLIENNTVYTTIISETKDEFLHLAINITDENNDWTYYEMEQAGMPLETVEINLNSQDTALPGDIIEFDGNLNVVGETDVYGFSLEYYLDNVFQGRFPTTFDENNNFEGSVRIPLDIDKDEVNLSVIFGGGGVYNNSEIIFPIDIIIPFELNASKMQYNVKEDEAFEINFEIDNLLDSNDTYLISYDTNLSNFEIDLDTQTHVELNSSKIIDTNLKLKNEIPGDYYFEISVNSVETNYTRDLYYGVNVSKKLTSSAGGGGGTPSVQEETEVIYKSEDNSVSFEKAVKNVEYILSEEYDVSLQKIRLNNDVENGQIRIKRNSLPSVTLANTHIYFEVLKEGVKDEDIDYAVLSFNVSKDWINENNFDCGDVRLFKLVGNSWREQDTNFVTADVNYCYFDSELDSFSYFAVSVDEEEINFFTVLSAINDYYEGTIDFWQVISVIDKYYLV